MTNHHSEDLPRDKRLLAALRHAPDHDAAPPAEVSARILAKAAALARQGSQQAAPSAPVRWQQAMMGWFRLPHFAAAFGTLAAGTLLGLLWSTQGPPDATAPPVSPQVVIAPVESMRDAATAPATKPEARPASAQAKLAESRATPPVLARADKDAAPQSLSKHKEEKAMPMRQEVDEAARLRSLAGATAPAPAAAPAPAVAQAQMAAKAAAAEAVTPQGGLTASGRLAAVSQDRRVADATAVGGADTASANAPPRLAAAAPDDPLPRLQALLGGATAGITWQLAARTLPHGDEQQRWWAQLRDGTQGRWRRDFAPQATPQPWVTLAVGGRALATLSIDGTFLRLRIGADQWQVVLSAAQALDWQQAVARW